MNIHTAPRNPHHKSDLVRIATTAMRERQLLAEFSAQVLQEVAAIEHAADDNDPSIRDQRQLLWCSIDNDDSLDLDQLTYLEPLEQGKVRLYVAIADVDALVKKGSAIDDHAHTNTASVYTSARIFPMLPERLSTTAHKRSLVCPSSNSASMVTEPTPMPVPSNACFPKLMTLSGM